jgi:hypothetical protein
MQSALALIVATNGSSGAGPDGLLSRIPTRIRSSTP